MELTELIAHPERLDCDTLYELRSLVALYPYFQTARLLMLQNLFLLHDPSFDEELRRAAIYITDRRVMFQMIEAAHYRITPQPAKASDTPSDTETVTEKTAPEDRENRTIALIDGFLESIPKDEPAADSSEGKPRRKPTPADASVDYVAYLLESESEDDHAGDVPQLIGQDLIDTFINVDKGKIVLGEGEGDGLHTDEVAENGAESLDEGCYTETLARIFIKQGRYSKALEIIQRLSLQYPKKNAYFADQIRFLEKLIINSNKKNK